jgi:mRNA interferase MazF
MRRGEVWWASLSEPTGAGPGYRRPVIIVQANEFNESSIRTVVVVAITSDLRRAAAPGNVLYRPRETGLRRESVANVSQLLTIDKRMLPSAWAVCPVACWRS